MHIMTSYFEHMLPSVTIMTVLCCCTKVILTSDQFRIDAKGPPRLVDSRYVRRHMVRAGARLRLPCPVESMPPALVNWHKDGDPIRLGWDRYRVRPEDDSLTIRDLQMDDTGVFTCHAANGFGSVDVRYLVYVLVDANASIPADFDEKFFEEMHQRGVAPVFTKPAEMAANSQIVLATGQTGRLHCRAVGRPRVNVLWFKDNKMLSSDYLPSGAAGSPLSSAEDMAAAATDHHRVRRHSRRRRADSDADSDHDMSSLHTQHLVRHSDVRTRQPVDRDQTAVTSPPIRQRHAHGYHGNNGAAADDNGSNDDDDGVVDDDRLTLRLERVTSQDAGRYTCRVFNKAGSLNFTYTVQVIDTISLRQKPAIVAPYPQNVTVTAGETAVLQCFINSPMFPRVQWLRRLEPTTTTTGDAAMTAQLSDKLFASEPYSLLQRTNGRTEVTATATNNVYHSLLTLNDVREADAGAYMCSVTTLEGDISWRVYLSVESALSQQQVNHVTNRTQYLSTILAAVVAITCSLAALGLATIFWIVLRNRRRQRLRHQRRQDEVISNNIMTSQQSKCLTSSSLTCPGRPDVGMATSGMQHCSMPLIAAYRLPPLPVMPPPGGNRSNYENEHPYGYGEHTYEHQYDVLEYRAPGTDDDGLPFKMPSASCSNIERVSVGVHRGGSSDGYTPWPPRLQPNRYSSSACSHVTAGSGRCYYDK